MAGERLWYSSMTSQKRTRVSFRVSGVEFSLGLLRFEFGAHGRVEPWPEVKLLDKQRAHDLLDLAVAFGETRGVVGEALHESGLVVLPKDPQDERLCAALGDPVCVVDEDPTHLAEFLTLAAVLHYAKIVSESDIVRGRSWSARRRS